MTRHMAVCPCCQKPFRDHLDPRMGERYLNGEIPSSIARDYGVSPALLRKWLSLLGVPMRTQKEGTKNFHRTLTKKTNPKKT